MRKVFLVFFVILVPLISGCAGSRQSVTFDTLRYPASMSRYLLDRENRKIGPTDYTTLASVKLVQTGWGVLYSYAPVNRIDFSEALNREIAAHKGDGIVNLKVITGSGGCLVWNAFPFVSAVPLWPGCVRVHITADVVRTHQEQ